jgi:hypothetical protein
MDSTTEAQARQIIAGAFEAVGPSIRPDDPRRNCRGRATAFPARCSAAQANG